MPETLRIEFLPALAAACAALSAFASAARAGGNAAAAAAAGRGANAAALNDSEQSPPDLAEAGGHSEAAAFLAERPGE